MWSPVNWWIVNHSLCHQLMFQRPLLKLDPSSKYSLDVDREASEEFKLENSNLYRGTNESCDHFLRRKHFLTRSLTEEERNYPLAFSILIFKSYVQFEDLLRAIHRPEHTICIHMDNKSSSDFQTAVNRLVKCFPKDEVFLLPHHINVNWGTYSTLEAEFMCMKTLYKLQATRKWKYYINLTGQEFPLRTNLELIRILSLLNGSNLMEATVKDRFLHRLPKSRVPFNMTWIKGAVHIVATPQFVNYSLYDWHAVYLRDLLSREGSIADEHFFSTLNHNPQLGTPGAYLGEPESNETTYPYINRAKEWARQRVMGCHSGRYKGEVCIFGIGDLASLVKHRGLFINKFHWDFQHLAQQCLREWYWNRTWEQTFSGPPHHIHINISWYSESLPSIRNHQ